LRAKGKKIEGHSLLENILKAKSFLKKFKTLDKNL
jgi:hypothetical protein